MYRIVKNYIHLKLGLLVYTKLHIKIKRNFENVQNSVLKK